MQIDRGEFTAIIRHINEIYAEAESLSCKTFMENCCACLTGYLLLLCMPTHYEKVSAHSGMQRCRTFGSDSLVRETSGALYLRGERPNSKSQRYIHAGSHGKGTPMCKR